jgi:uncharacterized delta-60 repeat protein
MRTQLDNGSDSVRGRVFGGRRLRRPRRAARPDVEGLEKREVMTAGYFDPTFGIAHNGMASFNLNTSGPNGWTYARGYAQAIQQDGRIVLAGTVGTSAGKEAMAVICLYSDGTLDRGFGSNGVQILYSYDSYRTNREAHAVAIDASGRIVLAGVESGDGYGSKMVIERLTSGGQIDYSFGLGGQEVVDFYQLGGDTASASAVAIDPQGRIVVAGSATDGSGVTEFAVVRLLSNGWMDSAFGNSGRQWVNFDDLGFNGDDIGKAVGIDPQGNIVVAGTAYIAGGIRGVFAVVRLDSGGHFDTGFGGGGRSYFGFGDLLGAGLDQAQAMAIDPQGNIIVAGSAQTGAGGYELAVGRLNASGWFDMSFGLGGRSYFSYSDLLGSKDAEADAVAVDTQGRIVVAGTSYTTGNQLDIVVARLSADGWCDSGFGLGGRSYFTYQGVLGGPSSVANAVDVDAQGRVVVAGWASTTGTGSDFIAARLDGGNNWGIPSSPAAAASQRVIQGLQGQDYSVYQVVRTDFSRDGQITRGDMIDVFNQVMRDFQITAGEQQALQALVANAGTLHMPGYVQDLANKVVNPSPGDLQRVRSSLGPFAFPVAQFQMLVNEWFLGTDEPDSSSLAYWTPSGGTLFSLFGPQANDVEQGNLGDCTVMASMAEVAHRNPGLIEDMFLDNGDGTYTVRFFNNGVPDYVTVNQQLPAGGTLYDRPVSGVLWAALAEKAYVQENGSGWLGTKQPGVYS